MAEPAVAPYGAWRSPISAERVVAGTLRFEQLLVDGETVYWTEGRPTEGGRQVVVRRTPDGRATDLTPPPFNARTRVHEYGGGAFTVVGDTLCFANFADQRLYRVPPGGAPTPLTPEAPFRYADLLADAWRDRLIAVREDHTDPSREPVNTLVAIPLAGGDGGRVLAAGNDFYAAPRLSPDGTRLAWLTWNHPNMPWDGCELWVGALEVDGSIARAERVAGGPEESIFQPEWSPDGTLFFASDRSGWWNLYRWQDGRIEPLCPREADFGVPQWAFAMSTYTFLAPDRIVCAFTERGTWRLGWLDTGARQLTPLDLPFTEISQVRAGAGRAVFVAGSPTTPEAVVQLDPKTGAVAVLRAAPEAGIEPAYLSAPEPIAFPTEGGQTAHAFYYPPRNRDFVGPPDERPPLVVLSHGGPTSAASTSLNLALQYFTSRGIAVVDVNYGGSARFGRAYRERLNGAWGLVDVDDCVNAARYLVARGDVDGARLAIRGGSAGGYTTLCALTFRDTFRAGASYYGVSDLEALAKETHKFESRYLDRLIGPYPERADLYRARSPIHFIDRLNCPLILFQGLEDKIVPPSQAELIFEAVRAKGLPVAYLPFEGEQHGFRRAENIQRALEAEFYFYARVFGFSPADPIAPVPIENL